VGTSAALLPATRARGTSRTQPRNHWSTYVFARASSRGAPSAAGCCIFNQFVKVQNVQAWVTTTMKRFRYEKEERAGVAGCRARRA